MSVSASASRRRGRRHNLSYESTPYSPTGHMTDIENTRANEIADLLNKYSGGVHFVTVAERAIGDALDQRDALASRLAEAERLLEPFAKAAQSWLSVEANGNPDDMLLAAEPPLYPEDGEFTLGDLRAASTFLTRSEDNG